MSTRGPRAARLVRITHIDKRRLRHPIIQNLSVRGSGGKTHPGGTCLCTGCHGLIDRGEVYFFWKEYELPYCIRCVEWDDDV